LNVVYAPEKYFERVWITATTISPNYRYRPDFATSLRRVWAFLKVCRQVGLNGRTGPLYWKTLFKVLVRNPRTAGVVVSMAALYTHYGRQAAFVARMQEEKIELVRRYGEQAYNQMMIAGSVLPADREHTTSDAVGSGSYVHITESQDHGARSVGGTGLRPRT
jgi:hypothetical protein